VKVENLDFCGYFQGKTKTNVMMRLTLNAWKTVIPDLVHECPYFGEATGSFRMPRQLAIMFPSGIHRTKFSFSIPGDDQKQQTVFRFFLDDEVS
jgi:hypothetical protein